jgi:hypothetical protein
MKKNTQKKQAESKNPKFGYCIFGSEEVIKAQKELNKMIGDVLNNIDFNKIVKQAWKQR